MGSNLETTIATYAIYGWLTMKNLITVRIVDSVAWEEQRISSTVTIVGCASTKASTQTTTVKAANRSPTAQCAKNFCSVREARLMKCPAAMLSTGNASDSWQRMIHVVQFAKRLQRRVNA